MSSNPCLVWHSIPESQEGVVEFPFELAKMMDNAPIYLHSCSEHFAKQAPVDIIQFGADSLFRSIISETPLAELYRNNQYAMWKPPAVHDVFITRGPKPLHTVQRLSQQHVHIVDGSYRGFFLHKDEYIRFHNWSDIKRFVYGIYRHHMRTMIQGSIHTVDTLVVNSEWTADVVKSLYNRPADRVIHPPMTLRTYTPDRANKTGERYYLYLGLIDRHHRIFELIDAFNKTTHALKIAGHGTAIDEAKRRAEDNIEFCGYVTGEEKRDLLANATALVNPANHSFGRAVIEALASGTPVVTLKAGYPSYVVERDVTGYIYERGADNLVDAIDRFEREGISASTEDLVAQTERYRQEKQEQKWRDVAGLT